ncbi:MAG: AzlD domain-containing protein [Peptococcia bacterium]
MSGKILLIILGMMAVTALPRILPLLILSKITIPPLILRWLRFIPVAVLSALLAPEIFHPSGSWNFSPLNPYLLSALACFIVVFKTKNIFMTIFTGMIGIVFLSWLF